mmetsp:Transcript_25718/g.53583  ORF Transcript_25718/g.53583 Transcript_25718/m.53583 type:complete len:233 (-) Transcript_25718:1928-2626(-)
MAFDDKNQDKLGDENEDKPNICNKKEMDQAFSVLGQFVKVMAYSLLLGVPQELIKLAAAPSPIGAVKEGEEMDMQSLDSEGTTNSDLWPFQKLVSLIHDEKGVRLPFLPESVMSLGRVLKLRLEKEQGRPIPDPWTLMAKAAANYSYIEYGYMILPGCKRPLDESQLEYEEALQRHEHRARQQGIPSSLIVPVAPLTQPASLGTNQAPFVTPPQEPETETEDNKSGWEYFAE